MSARDRILGRVREALSARNDVDHPGAFGGWRPVADPPSLEAFVARFTAAGGEVVRVASEHDAGAWLVDFCKDAPHITAAAVGAGVPATLRPNLVAAPPANAALGVSMARWAVGETGSLVLGAEDGRRAQLLPPTHIVFLHAGNVHASLGDALTALKPALPSALGLHSGPSKSADIGQILVKGVHGPGRVIAVLIGETQAS